MISSKWLDRLKDKKSETLKNGTDKTDKRAFVSFVGSSQGHIQKIEVHPIRAYLEL